MSLAVSEQYDTIIIAGNMGEFDRNPSAFCQVEGRACLKSDHPARRDELVRSNVNAWQHLLALGKEVVVVKQVPVAPYELPKNEMRRHYLGLPERTTYIERRPAGAGGARYLDDVVVPLVSHPKFVQLDIRSELCAGDVCRADDPVTGLPVFFDRSHFTPEWIRAHGGALRVHVNRAAVRSIE